MKLSTRQLTPPVARCVSGRFGSSEPQLTLCLTDGSLTDSSNADQMNANGGGLVTPTGAPVRRPPGPGWSPLVHAREPRKVYHEAGGGPVTRTSPTITRTVAFVSRLFERKLAAAGFYEDSDEDFWDEADAEWACGICNDDGGDEEQGGDVEQDDDGDGQVCEHKAGVIRVCMIAK